MNFEHFVHRANIGRFLVRKIFPDVLFPGSIAISLVTIEATTNKIVNQNFIQFLNFNFL
jgi:hypothetical protein